MTQTRQNSEVRFKSDVLRDARSLLNGEDKQMGVN